jgi:thiol-disulfide isomerase/thioredoxin
MMRRLTTWTLACLLAAGTVAAQSPAPKSGKKDAAPVADPIVIDQAGYAGLLAKHRGKPVMVDFWATWCEPCRTEYPMVNELAQKYAPQGLVVLGVSLDEDGELILVRRFLARVQPAFANYRKKPGKEEPFINSVDQKWSGAIPASFFYAPDGRLVTSLVGEHSREEFEATIQELLRQSQNSAASRTSER